MKANVYAALLNLDRSESWAIPQYSCPSGNCTWDPIIVLAASYNCTDLTSQLTVKCGKNFSGHGVKNLNTNCEVSLPQGPQLRYSSHHHMGSVFTMGSRFLTVMGTDKYPQYPFFKVRSIRANIDFRVYEQIMSLSQSTEWLAKECIVSPGVSRISSMVVNGKYKEVKHDFYDSSRHKSTDFWSTWENFSPHSGIFNNTHIPSPEIRHMFPSRGKGSSWGDSFYIGFQPPPWPADSPKHNRDTYGLSWIATQSISTFLKQLFQGTVATAGDSLGFFIDQKVDYLSVSSAPATQDVLHSVFYGTLVGCGSDRDPLECAMENTVKAMTKTFRDAAFVEHGYSGANMTIGKTLVEQTYIQIQWAWIILPALVWSLSVVVWIATVWRTWVSGIPMWRNNPLPLLFLYRPANENASIANGNISSLAYTRRARKIVGQLYATSDVQEPRID